MALFGTRLPLQVWEGSYCGSTSPARGLQVGPQKSLLLDCQVTFFTLETPLPLIPLKKKGQIKGRELFPFIFNKMSLVSGAALCKL